MKLVYLTIQVVFIGVLLGVAGLFLLPLLPIENNIQLRIVESGSMEPAIMTGSLVVIVPATEYKIGEVVTFKSPSADIPTTHRIIDATFESGNTIFTTKGDANEEADSVAVMVKDVIGRVVITVPYVGFILDFARQPIGFSLLILLPALMIICAEIEKVWIEIKARRKNRAKEVSDDDNMPTGGEVMAMKSKPLRMMDVGTPIQYRSLPTYNLMQMKPLPAPVSVVGNKKFIGEWALMSLILIGSSIFVSATFFPYTASYFNDAERLIGNTMRAVAVDFTVSSEVSAFNFLGTNLDSENSSIINVVEPVSGSVEAKYDMRVEFKGGSELFCDAIVADMTVLPTVYTGPLLLLAAVDVDFTGPWSLVLTLDENVVGYLLGDFCQVDVVYTAWHHDEVNGVGYTDEERVPLVLNAPAETEASNILSTALLPLSTSTGTPEILDEVLSTEEEGEVIETLPEPEEEVIVVTEPETESGTELQLETEPVTESKSETELETETMPITEPEIGSQLEAELDSVAEPEPEPHVEPESESVVEEVIVEAITPSE